MSVAMRRSLRLMGSAIKDDRDDHLAIGYRRRSGVKSALAADIHSALSVDYKAPTRTSSRSAVHSSKGLSSDPLEGVFFYDSEEIPAMPADSNTTMVANCTRKGPANSAAEPQRRRTPCSCNRGTTFILLGVALLLCTGLAIMCVMDTIYAYRNCEHEVKKSVKPYSLDAVYCKKVHSMEDDSTGEHIPPTEMQEEHCKRINAQQRLTTEAQVLKCFKGRMQQHFLSYLQCIPFIGDIVTPSSGIADAFTKFVGITVVGGLIGAIVALLLVFKGWAWVRKHTGAKEFSSAAESDASSN